ncbi:MAG: tRNA pseudouridine(55) synthase TruB [Deltaproteobacteria bacterium]|nr:tRNA pseudouridine(55) synthase TruB [Deltaproteobacteria bacterium]
MDGVLIIDKPKGLTSHDVVLRAKRVLGAKKVGHLGTLDPMATGVLPLVINRAAKYADLLSGGSKEYVATLKLGEERDTFDGEGRVVKTFATGGVGAEDVERVLKGFCGRIKQIPPMFSAVKKNGVPLYKLARKGITVPREPKEIEVYSMDVLAIGLPCVTFRAVCSKGTYVRTLCHDAGQTLGCGAYLKELKRTRSGRFTLDTAVLPDCPEGLLRERIIPLEALILDAAGGVEPEEGWTGFLLHSFENR